MYQLATAGSVIFCEQAGLEPHPTYLRLAEQYQAPRLRGPFNFEARRNASFDELELDALVAQDRDTLPAGRAGLSNRASSAAHRGESVA